MLKKIIILICILFIYGISNTNAATYTSTLPESDAHKGMEIALVAFVLEYLDEHGQDITDMNEFRWKVAEIITANGGRLGPDDKITQANIGAFAIIDGNKLYVGCGNINFGFFELPVCSKYIKEWKQTRGDCNISSDWTIDGKIECTQNSVYEKVEAECGYTYCGPKICPPPAIEPTAAAGTAIKTISLNLESPVSNCTGIYANDSDQCSLTLRTDAVATNDNKPVLGLVGKKTSNISDSSKIPSDRVNLDLVFNPTSNNALVFEGITEPEVKKEGNIFSLTFDNIRSVSPFSSNTGKIKFDIKGLDTNTSLEAKNINYRFLKPFSGNLEVVSGGLIVSMVQTLKLNVIKDTNHYTIPTSYKIANYKDSFTTENKDYTITNKDNEKNLTTKPEVDLKIDYDGTTDMGTTNVITRPYISYNIGPRIVRYYLSDNARAIAYTDPDEDSGIQLESEEFLGVKIIGSQQLDGKYMVTGQEDNISDIAKLELKNKIRQNAYNLTKNMKSGQVLNRVKYYSDTTDINITGVGIDGTLPYDTLIVKNSNVIISGDILQNLGIIVLKDNYNVKTDYNKKGNVYIKPNVGYIEAIIYADGGFISVNINNLPVNNSPERNTIFSNQLVLKGSIFTKNTVGGAIGAAAGYLLPGGERTQDLNIATMYDFNYTRTGHDGANTHNMGFRNPFIIIYDPKVQIDPPKGFN